MALTKVVTNAITDDAVTAAKIADGTIVAADLAANSVDSSELVNASVDLAHMSVNSIDSDQYVDGSIDNAHIADDAIDSEHYADGSIDNAHIADDAINSEHYADGSIDNAHIADDAIDSEHYADGSIDNAHIADDQIDSEHYADGSIDLAHMSSQSVDEDNLYISNSGSNGQALTKQSGNNGGLTWATIATTLTGIDDQSSSNDDQLTITDTAIIINEDSDDLDFRVESNGDANLMIIDGGADNVSFSRGSAATDQAIVHISRGGYNPGSNGKHALMVGADQGDANTMTNSTRKQGSIVGPHYTNAEEPITFMRMDSDNGSSELRIGGTAETNATEKIIFRTATDDANKATGVDHLTIDSTGRGISEFTAKAWAHFDGTGTPSIQDSHNVADLTDSETGQIRVNFTASLANANYAAMVNSWWGYAYTGGAMDIYTDGFKATTSNGSAYTDVNSIMVLVFGS